MQRSNPVKAAPVEAGSPPLSAGGPGHLTAGGGSAAWLEILTHPLFLRFASIVTVMAGWEYAGRVPISPAFPTFLETMSALGVLMGRSIIADRIFLPWVNLFLSAPLTALVPVIMVIFGLGETTIIMTVVLFAIWIIVLDARAGVRAISPSLVEMARCFGASRWQAFSKVYLLAALPEILAGIRLGMIRAVKGVVIGQLLVSIIGFGKLFELYSSRFLMEHFWALLFVLFAFAFTLNEVLAWLERKLDYYAAARQ